MAITDNAQIKFRHGSQTALDTLKSSSTSKIEVGTFYLTDDTHRLYIGIQKGTGKDIVSVNEGITTYTAQTLPTPSTSNAGQFAYIPNANVLCVSNGVNWIQLNHNTDTLYDYSGLVSQDSTSKLVTVKTGITPTDNEDTDQTESGSEDSFSFALKGENGIVLSVTDSTISVYGTELKYAVNESTNVATIKLVDDNDKDSSSVTVKGGANVTITNNSDNKGFVITADDTTLDGEETHGSNLDQGFKIVATDTSGNTSGGTIDPIIKYGSDAGTSVHFVKGEAVLDVYTKSEIDSKVTDFNAMEYRGVTSSLPSGDIKNGYTWKADADFTNTLNGKSYDVKVGDLVIARGTEVEGFIPRDTIEFGIVPSGNEDTTYKVETIDYGIKIKEYFLGAEESEAETIGQIVIKGDTQKATPSGAIAVSSAPNNDKTAQTLTIEHIEESRVDPAFGTANINSPLLEGHGISSATIEVIDAEQGTNGIDTDGYGHITAVHTKQYTIYDTNAALTEVETTTSAASNVGTVKVSATVTQSDNTPTQEDDSFTIASTNANLTITNASGSKGLELNLVWGTFN